MIDRKIRLPSQHSFFLLGARGTGKSSLLRAHFQVEPQNPQLMWFDLLDPRIEDRFIRDPGLFKDEILFALQNRPNLKWIVVDEIQKVPKLLNSVHSLIESTKLQFALSGSSARRLKQKGVNLLAGRAVQKYLFPLTQHELGADFNLNQALQYGSLPKVQQLKTAEEKCDFLSSYVYQYIQLEVQQEQWVRKIEPFRKFLPIAAQMNRKVINYSKIAKEVGVETDTVQSYFEILEDTLIGHKVHGYDRSIRKQLRVAPKFYFFDTGVKRAIIGDLDLKISESTSDFGDSFEHWFFLELNRTLSYEGKAFQINYLQTKDDAEIDFVVSRGSRTLALIEVKSKTEVIEADAKSLFHFQSDFKQTPLFLASRDPKERKWGRVWALPWYKVIEELKD
jgi:predicted AAA+ superfamily ATPase